jgi:O-antigen ligase
MNVKVAINKLVDSENFFPYLIALLLSTLFIGYAPSSITLGILVITSIYFASRNKISIDIDFSLYLPIILYLLFCTTLFWTVDSTNTIKGIERTISLLIIPIVFILIPRFNNQKRNIVLKYFTISNALYGLFFIVIAFFKFYNSGDYNVFTYHDLVSIFDLNAIYVSTFFLISIFYLLRKTNKTKSEKVSLIFLINMLFLLSSKMVLTVFFIGLIVYGFSFEGIKKLKSPKVILLLLGLLIVIGFSSRQLVDRVLVEKSTDFNEVLNNDKFNRVYPWTGTSFRLLQLRILSDQIKEENIIWKGFGLFASRKNLKDRHLAFNTYYGYHTYNYHNMYAQILSETGILGLILILLMLANSLRNAIKINDLVFIIFSVMFFMVFITESFLWVHRGLFFFLIMYCLFNRSILNNLKTRKKKE